jgi:hypothetical protein
MDQLRSVAEVYRLLKVQYGNDTTNFTNAAGGDGLLIKNDIEAAGGLLMSNSVLMGLLIV